MNGPGKDKRSFPIVQQHHKNTKVFTKRDTFHGHGGCVMFLLSFARVAASQLVRRVACCCCCCVECAWATQALRLSFRLQPGFRIPCSFLWVLAFCRPVWCLDFQDDTLVSGSYDRTINVWSLKHGNCMGTLRGHASTPLGSDCSLRFCQSLGLDLFVPRACSMRLPSPASQLGCQRLHFRFHSSSILLLSLASIRQQFLQSSSIRTQFVVMVH
jgi:hypothetical protein